ncbi:MAG: hypothetical protein AAF771_16315 [Pseudomonadota bacterium]
MQKITLAAGFAAIIALSGCGDTDIERGVTGAAIGAGASLAVDGDLLTGALIGGTAGVLCDDLTNAC